MISVNMHDAKCRLSELVKTVEEQGETVILCRNGEEVAEIRRRPKSLRSRRTLSPDPSLRAEWKAGYDPAEPLSAAEWPTELR